MKNEFPRINNLKTKAGGQRYDERKPCSRVMDIGNGEDRKFFDPGPCDHRGYRIGTVDPDPDIGICKGIS